MSTCNRSPGLCWFGVWSTAFILVHDWQMGMHGYAAGRLRYDREVAATRLQPLVQRLQAHSSSDSAVVPKTTTIIPYVQYQLGPMCRYRNLHMNDACLTVAHRIRNGLIQNA